MKCNEFMFGLATLNRIWSFFLFKILDFRIINVVDLWIDFGLNMLARVLFDLVRFSLYVHS